MLQSFSALPVSELLHKRAHRPYEMPASHWVCYQEWHQSVFAHWRVGQKILEPLIPKGLELDLFQGEAWVSVVAFSIRKLRPRFLPHFPPISNFHELNVRTYVRHNGKPGVYFLSIEAEKLSSTLMARTVFGLPYVRSQMFRDESIYKSLNSKHKTHLLIDFSIGEEQEMDSLDRWLTERYCLYNHKKGRLFSNDIHHVEWPIQSLKINQFDLSYQFGDLRIKSPAELYRFSPGVQVLAWGTRWL